MGFQILVECQHNINMVPKKLGFFSNFWKKELIFFNLWTYRLSTLEIINTFLGWIRPDSRSRVGSTWCVSWICLYLLKTKIPEIIIKTKNRQMKVTRMAVWFLCPVWNWPRKIFEKKLAFYLYLIFVNMTHTNFQPIVVHQNRDRVMGIRIKM